MASPKRGLRLRRILLAGFVAASMVVPLSDTAHTSAVPAPAPGELAPLKAETPASLSDRYARNLDNIVEAARMAAEHGIPKRASELQAMADNPDRQFLSFDGRDDGQAVEVFGDLAKAERVAVMVPGSDTSLDRYQPFRNAAVDLLHELDGPTAVVAWYGYRTPQMWTSEVLTAGLADNAAPKLSAFMADLAAFKPAADISVLCHSYGSVVCTRAAATLRVSDIVLYGSPGTGVVDVAALQTSATVWAGRGSRDWVMDLPHVQLPLLFATIGFGTDPASPEFGANTFAAGNAGHGDYLHPGSISAQNIARIVSGTLPSEEPRE